jgi:NADH-quinone oxidoreductase subunit M
MHDWTLTLIVFGPIALGSWLLITKETNRQSLMETALFASCVPFLYSLSLLWKYSPAGDPMQCAIRLPFIVIADYLRIEYYMGVDGISLFLVLLTTFLTPIAILSTLNSIQKNYRVFLFMLLALETAILGTFVSLDLILFYIFWEATLIPMYFIIGVWGSGERIKSAMKFVIFTMTGSVLMLVAILVLYSVSAGRTFDLVSLFADPAVLKLGRSAQMWLFWAFFLAFAIKVPIFPLHTWLPDAHTDAPTAGSVILAGILLKMGAYGLLRFCLPLFPVAAHASAPIVATLAVIGIIYGAWVATVQRDIKRLIAYSSVSHLGLVVLGIFAFTPNAVTGAVLQMVNHGLTTGALFLLVGILYDRRHTRKITDFGGLIKVMPLFGVILWIIAFGSIGLPPLNGFIGEFLILFGVFQTASPMYLVFGAFAVTGVIWGAVYMLWMIERVMLGRITHEENRGLKDLDQRELLMLIPIVILVFGIGFFSPTFTGKIQPGVTHVLELAARGAEPVGSGKWNQSGTAENRTTTGDSGTSEPAQGAQPPISTGGDEPGVYWDETSGSYVTAPGGGGG